MKAIVKAPITPEESKRELQNRELSRKAASEGIVLLENNGILPLKNNRIAYLAEELVKQLEVVRVQEICTKDIVYQLKKA